LFTRTDLSLRQRRAGDMSQEEALEAQAAGGSAVAASVDWALVSAVEVSAAVRAGALGPAAVDALDKSALRAALLALELPTAGKQEDLRKRLRAGLQAAAEAKAKTEALAAALAKDEA
jgi:hypothetical protein